MSKSGKLLGADCKDMMARQSSQGGVAALLKEYLKKTDWLEAVRAEVGDDEEFLLFHDAELTIVHVRLSQNVHFPVHNHCMPVLVGMYEGAEYHRLYRLEDDRPAFAGEFVIPTGEVRGLGPDAIHSVCNIADSGYARSIHIYLGDLVRQPRYIWSRDGNTRCPYSDADYFHLAEPFDPSKPFVQPIVCHAHAEVGPPSG